MGQDEWSFSQMFEEKEDGVKQDSAEWHVWRGKGLGSSDAAVLMYKSPWKEIDDLFLEKTGLKKSEIKNNFAMQRGKDMEPIARDIYNFQNKCEMRPSTFVHPRYPFMRASMDGFSRRLGHGLEIKVPGKKDVALARQGLVPEKYYPQLQWLMSCSQSKKIDFCTLDPEGGEFFQTEVLLDLDYEKRMIALARWFWYLVKNKVQPPLRQVRICEIDSSGYRMSKLQGGKKVFK
jgi:putative phage-type endonuclease